MAGEDGIVAREEERGGSEGKVRVKLERRMEGRKGSECERMRMMMYGRWECE